MPQKARRYTEYSAPVGLGSRRPRAVSAAEGVRYCFYYKHLHRRLTSLFQNVILMVKCYDWEDTLMNAEQYRAVIGWFNAKARRQKRRCGSSAAGRWGWYICSTSVCWRGWHCTAVSSSGLRSSYRRQRFWSVRWCAGSSTARAPTRRWGLRPSFRRTSPARACRAATAWRRPSPGPRGLCSARSASCWPCWGY